MLSYLGLDVNIFLIFSAASSLLDMVLKRFPAAGLWLCKISNNLQNLRFGKNHRLTKKTLMI